jgi:hypothetical protein
MTDVGGIGQPDQPDGASGRNVSTPLVASLAQWIWLLDFSGNADALDASPLSTGDLSTALLGHFDSVHLMRSTAPVISRISDVARVEGWAPATTTLGALRTSTWSPESFDCIALHDLLIREPQSRENLAADLDQAHRILRSGGWLSLASSSSGPLRSGASTSAVPSRRDLETMLRRAGFTEIRCLFAEPTLERPLVLVPDKASAVALYDSRYTRALPKRMVRWAMVRTPLRAQLFSTYFLLARA